MWAPSNRAKLGAASSTGSASSSSEKTSKPLASKVASSSSSSSKPAGTAPTKPPPVPRSASGKHDLPPHQTHSRGSSAAGQKALTLGEEASRQRAYAALNNPQTNAGPGFGGSTRGNRGGYQGGHGHGQQHAGFTVVEPSSSMNGGRRGGSASGRGNRRQEKEELWKSIWGDSDEEDNNNDDSKEKAKSDADDKSKSGSQNGSAAKPVVSAKSADVHDDDDSDDPNQPGVVDKDIERESRDRTDPGLKKKLGVEDSIWAPKNRAAAAGSVGGKKDQGVGKEKVEKKVDDLGAKIQAVKIEDETMTVAAPEVPAQPASAAPTSTPAAPAEPVKPKTLEPISRFLQTDPTESSGINWADDDEEDEVGGFMEDVMAQWGMGGAAATTDKKEEEEKVEEEVADVGADSGVEDDKEPEQKVEQEPTLEPVAEEQEKKEDVRPKAAKIPLADRIDWDRRTAAPAVNEPPRGPSAGTSSWRSDSNQHHQYPRHDGAPRGGRGRGGHSRQQSFDHSASSYHHDRQARAGNGRRPTELLSLPDSPVTPASTAIVTPTPSTTSADEHPPRNRKAQGHDETVEARKTRTERPKLALQDSTFKRMTRGLLGGPGGQGGARPTDGGNTNNNNRFVRKQDARQAPASPVIPLASVEPAIATLTGIPDDFGGNDDGWNEVKPKGRSQRGRKRNA